MKFSPLQYVIPASKNFYGYVIMLPVCMICERIVVPALFLKLHQIALKVSPFFDGQLNQTVPLFYGEIDDLGYYVELNVVVSSLSYVMSLFPPN